MFPIDQSPFLHALGYAIGHSLWQMSLLWLVYTALVHLHQWKSSQRYNLAVGAASIGFLWFIVTLFYFAFRVDIQPSDDLATATMATGSPFTPAGKAAYIYHSFMATLRSLAPYLSCAYLFVMLVLSIRLANGFKQVKQLRTTGISKAPVDWRLFVKNHASCLGIKKQVNLFVSKLASSPLTIGFWKPIILIPLASINQLTPQQLEAVLLHELAHIRRYDYLFNILLQLAEISLFFNPFMRLLLKQARLERENSCDDYVLQFRYNAADYAKALLTIEQYSVESLLALGTNGHNESQLLNRIKRMVAPERRAFNYRQQLGLLFLITLLGLGFTVINPKQTVTASLEKNVTTVTVSSPLNIPGAPQQPPAVDLVKNLEKISEFKRTNSKQEQEKNEQLDRVEKAGEQLGIALQPHLNQVEAKASQMAAKIDQALSVAGKFDLKDLQMQLKTEEINKELAKVEWPRLLAPIIKEGERSLAFFPGLMNAELMPLFAETPESPAARPNSAKKWESADFDKNVRQQLIKVKKLQENLEREQKRLSRRQQVFSDSIRMALEIINPGEMAAYEEAMAKAQKQLAIAPFRVQDMQRSEANLQNNVKVYFNYNNNRTYKKRTEDTAEDDEEDDVSTVYNSRPVVSARGGNCGCPDQNKAKGKSVVVINGKALSDKVKQVWAEAKENGWTDEMQNEVKKEIEKQLNQIEHVEIRTHVMSKTDRNGNGFVIEVESQN